MVQRLILKELFSHPSRGCGKNVIIFGANFGSSVHANNRANNILALVKDVIQGINDTTFYAEKNVLK